MTRDQAIEAARRFGAGWIAIDDDGGMYWVKEQPEYHGKIWRSESDMHFIGCSDDGRVILEKAGG